MGFMRKSLSQDSVDHCSRTWACLLILMLSIIMLFVPLSPSMILTPAQSFPSTSTNTMKMDDDSMSHTSALPTYRASCWTPAHFTGAMVHFTNGVCSSALNSAIQGNNFTGASVYDLPRDELIPTEYQSSSVITAEDFKDLRAQLDKAVDKSKTKNEASLQTARDKVYSDLREFIGLKVPLHLFIFAICLTLPYAVWSILTSCCGCMNVDQTLMAAQTTFTSISGDQNSLKEESALTLGYSTKRATTLLYLLMKLLMIVVVCAESVVVRDSLLVETDRLERDLASVDKMNSIAQGLPQQSAGDQTKESTSMSSNQTFPNYFYMCDFKIRQLQDLQHYTVQCVFNPEIKNNAATDNTAQVPVHQSQSGTVSEMTVLLAYKAMSTMVLALLVVLAILNIASLVVWLLKLFLSSCRPGLGLKTDASLDVVFLVSMAWNNTSGLAAMALAKCFVRSGYSGSGDGESSQLK